MGVRGVPQRSLSEACRKAAQSAMKKPPVIIIYVLTTMLLAACGATRIPGVHRIDIQQGNILTPDAVRQLSPGMERRQVRLLLGTPLVVDPFEPNRWIYLYLLQEANGTQTRQTLSVYFKDDKLARVAGDIRAIEENKELAAGSQRVVSVPDQRRDRGLFGLVARVLGMAEPDSPSRDDEPLPRVRGAAAIEDPNSRLPTPR